MVCVTPILVSSYVMTKWICTGQQIKNSKITFFNMATLTYDLDLQSYSRYCQGQPPYQTMGPYVKRFSRERADRRTHRQTDGTDFITSTADAGGNNLCIVLRREIALNKNYIALIGNEIKPNGYYGGILLLITN